MKKLFDFVAWFNVYFNSFSKYLTIINFFLILLTFKSVYNINIKSVFLIPLMLFIGFLIGFIDYKFIQIPQNLIANKTNDIKSDLLEIKKLLEVKNENYNINK